MPDMSSLAQMMGQQPNGAPQASNNDGPGEATNASAQQGSIPQMPPGFNAGALAALKNDPAILAKRNDPAIAAFLDDLDQNGPEAAMRHMSNPVVMEVLMKLMNRSTSGEK